MAFKTGRRGQMTIRDMALATIAAVIWGFGFIAIKFGLESFSPPQLTALRFILAAVPFVFLQRPAISLPMLIAIGLTLYTGQFLLLFFAFQQGLPPGVASVTQQIQAFFTVLLAACLFRERPTLRQCFGIVIALCGLVLVGLTVGGDITWFGLILAIGAAVSWSIGNILVKREGNVPMFPLMVWLSLIPPLPALLVSGLDSGSQPFLAAVAEATWPSWGGVIYLAVFATILAFAIWGDLLSRYPAAMIAPFSLLTPCTGILASALIFHEVFPMVRYAGMALIVGGLAVVLLPVGRRRALEAARP
jgi:O-acetylserine/cysteine efflux transporter